MWKNESFRFHGPVQVWCRSRWGRDGHLARRLLVVIPAHNASRINSRSPVLSVAEGGRAETDQRDPRRASDPAVSRVLAIRIPREHERFIPLVAASEGVAYPRLGVIAPTRRARDAALAELTPLGATRLYPSPLDRVEKLQPHRVEAEPCPGAHEFASRLLTLPTHAGLRPRHVDEVVRTLGA